MITLVLSSMDEHHLSLNSMEKILRSAGAQRVSREAKEELRSYLQKHAEEVGKVALTYTDHANRTTVQAEDITSAINVQ